MSRRRVHTFETIWRRIVNVSFTITRDGNRENPAQNGTCAMRAAIAARVLAFA
jgi:hypothetical protein